MSVLGAGEAFMLASGEDAAYTIQRSLRFENDDGAYLSRNFAAGNRKKWTWSSWVKRSELGRVQNIFRVVGTSSDTTIFQIRFMANDAIGVVNYSYFPLISNAVFRDVGAWLHLVVSLDVDQFASANKLRFYINGSELTSWATDNRSSLGGNAQGVNQASVAHEIGGQGSSEYFSGSLAEIHFVDGQALAPTDFGKFDADTGVWNPIAYTGSHNYSTGTVYSTSSSGMSNPGLMFDGNTSTSPSLTADGTVYTMLTGVSISCSTSLRINANANSFQVSVNGGAYTSATSVNSTWLSLSVPSGNTLTSLTFKDGAGGGYGVRALEVDGTVLVDGSVGVNGFHLDFSDNSSDSALGNDAAGNNNWSVNNLNATSVGRSAVLGAWTSGWSGTQMGGYAPGNMFDGSTGTLTAFGSGGGTWSKSTGNGIPASSSVELFYILRGSSSVSVNGNSLGLSEGWQNISSLFSFPTEITSITMSQNSGNGPDIRAMKVDGKFVVDNAYSANYPYQTPDSLIDSPTNYEADSGNNGGNYATLNLLDSKSAAISNGNLEAQVDSSGDNFVRGTIGVSSGKWYWEFTTLSSNNMMLGAADVTAHGNYNNGNVFAYYANGGALYGESSGKASSWSGTTLAVGDIFGVALDMDNGTLKFYKNGSLIGTAWTGLTGRTIAPYIGTGGGSGNKTAFNAGQRPFSISSVPTGHKSLCAQNLDDPLIADPSTAFDTSLWTGNGSTQSITGLSFSPDFVWIKNRGNTADHRIYDTVRGALKEILPNQTNAETTRAYSLTAFNSDGYSLGSYGGVNNNGTAAVGWAWDAGSSNTSFSVGSLNSSVYNTSRVWSNGIANSSSDFDQPATNAFNGDRSNKLRTGGNSVLVTLNFSPALTVASTIEILGEDYATANFRYTVTVDGTTTTKDVSQGQPALFNVSGSLTQITFDNNNSNGRTYLEWIRVDGKELIDSNVTPPNAPSIASTCRANQTAGFSIVSFTAPSSSTSSYSAAHGLNATPTFWIWKSRSAAGGWQVYSTALGTTNNRLALNSTDSAYSNYPGSATSSLINLSDGPTAAWGGTNIIYAFTPVPGFSHFTTFEGTGSADPVFVHCGFRPRWILKKNADDTKNWYIHDTARSPFNAVDKELMAHSNGAEGTHIALDILSNGFAMRTSNAQHNASNNTYIVAAFAENPFKIARAQ